MTADQCMVLMACEFVYIDRYKFPPAMNEDSLYTLMDTEIRQKIGIIPSNITWGGKIYHKDLYYTLFYVMTFVNVKSIDSTRTD